MIDLKADDTLAKRERRKQARPGELLDAALSLFVEKGYAATRVEEVAARAGVSKGTLFLYYASKADLFKAVVAESIGGRMAEWNEEFDRFTGTTHEMLRYCLHSWWERIGATRACGITKLVVSESENFPELATSYRREVVEPGHALIRRILQRGIDRGEIRPVDLDLAIYSIIGPMVFLTLSQHTHCFGQPGHPPLDPRHYLDMQADILLRGLQQTGGTAP